jgi:HEPN domain-containing protein
MNDSEGIHCEWFEKGLHHIEVAQFLYDHGHYTDAIALHIHQALEKHLKGFLLKNGWILQNTHDLITLASRAESFGLDLRDREDALDRINEYYVESRYPLGALTEYSRQEIAGSLGTATEIIDLIKRMS